jgi:F-type H+-transporting ATPase subunit a
MSESSGNALTAGEYIGHHLVHLQNHPQKGMVDFSVFHIDTIFWSIALGVIGLFVMWRVAKNVHSGVPGRMQAAVEILLEMVDGQAKVDLFHSLFAVTGIENTIPNFRVVPTADLSATLGMSCGVLLVCLFYNIKIKGFGGWVHELFSAPFGDKWFLYPINFLMQMIEFAAKTVSHGLRLFGNMYAGELLFMLIALMGAVGFGSATGVFLFIGHVLAGTGWAIFHILIVALQAFIFMMLTLVYVGQAHDHH